MVGTAAETGAVMPAYLDEACKRRKAAGGLKTLEGIIQTVHLGAVERIRPMAMIGMGDGLISGDVGDRYRGRCHEAHRGAPGRRRVLRDDPDADRHSACLCIVALAEVTPGEFGE